MLKLELPNEWKLNPIRNHTIRMRFGANLACFGGYAKEFVENFAVIDKFSSNQAKC